MHSALLHATPKYKEFVRFTAEHSHGDDVLPRMAVSVERSPESLLTCIDIRFPSNRYQISRKIARDSRDLGIDIFFVKNQ